MKKRNSNRPSAVKRYKGRADFFVDVGPSSFAVEAKLAQRRIVDLAAQRRLGARYDLKKHVNKAHLSAGRALQDAVDAVNNTEECSDYRAAVAFVIPWVRTTQTAANRRPAALRAAKVAVRTYLNHGQFIGRRVLRADYLPTMRSSKMMKRTWQTEPGNDAHAWFCPGVTAVVQFV
ncbi:MAG TPA: hypothetical protein VEI02_15205 [Planctomycetota bacterium]|nr:hypothetical protein [Planctomycetota bacterium]